MHHSDKQKLFREMMLDVHKAVARGRRLDTRRGYFSVSLPLPGLATTATFRGHAVADLLLPECLVPFHERQTVFNEVMPWLSSPKLHPDEKLALRRLVGKQLLDFMLVCDTPQGRLARLLWVFGADMQREVGQKTLMVSFSDVRFGICEGKLVGSAYDGVSIDVQMGEFLEVERVVNVRNQLYTDIRRVLHNRVDQEAFEMFCILYAVAEWDKTIPLSSLMLPKPKKLKKTLAAVQAELFESPDPYLCLFKTLVPYYMTYNDFRNILGKPEGRGNVGQSSRIRLVNKVSLLPFFN